MGSMQTESELDTLLKVDSDNQINNSVCYNFDITYRQ